MNNNNNYHLELLNICACNQLKLHITIHNFIMLTHMSADHYAQNFLLKVSILFLTVLFEEKVHITFMTVSSV